MRTMRIIKSGFRTAWTHKVRSIFMVLSVMIGIAALTVVMSLGQGTETKITAQVRKFFSANSIMLVSGGETMRPNRPVALTGNLKLTEADAIAQHVARISSWDAVQRAPGKEVQANGSQTQADISGQMPSADIVWNLAVTSGRFYSEAENRSSARVAVLTPHVCEKLFGTSDPIGQIVTVDNIPFEVIGVIGPRGLDPHGIDKDNEILIPLNTLLRRVMNIDRIMFAKFLVSDEKLVESAAGDVSGVMRTLHGLSADEADDFLVVTPVRVQHIIQNATRMFNLYLPLLAIVALIVGGSVVVNLMLISVTERESEIGLRKAVGARSEDIAVQFIIEAASMTILSGVLGMALGIAVFARVAERMNLPAEISWIGLIASVLVSIIVGIAAGYLPARRAAELSPITSLRK